MSDDREARLPRWAQDTLSALRRRLADAERLAEEARLATDPDESSAIIHPYDEVPIGLGNAVVRFKLDDGEYVEVQVRDGHVTVMGSSATLIMPYSSNHFAIKTRGRFG